MSDRHVLLVRLAAPLQSWGVGSRFTYRDSHSRPTKSGVLGLCAAALGRDRRDDIGDLVGLRFGVRADRPGTPMRDYHTIGGGTYPLRPRDLITDHRRADAVEVAQSGQEGDVFGHHTLEGWYGSPKYIHADPGSGTLVSRQLGRDPLVTERWYLADAAFVVGLEHHDRAFLEEIAHALEHPRRLLWLGRKSCPPTGTLAGPLVEGTVEEAFTGVAALPEADEGSRVWAWIEPSTEHVTGAGEQVLDQPVTFDSGRRAHSVRWERRTRVTIADTATEWEVVP